MFVCLSLLRACPHRPGGLLPAQPLALTLPLPGVANLTLTLTGLVVGGAHLTFASRQCSLPKIAILILFGYPDALTRLTEAA